MRPLAARSLASTLAAALALATACTPDPPPSGGVAPPTHVAIAIPSPDAPPGPIITNLTRTRLVRIDQTGHERPSIVERWRLSDDHRRWTLTVRDGVRLHDGTIATADQVAARIRSSLENSESQPGLWDVRSVDVIDARTVVITLGAPTSLLLEALSLVESLPAGPFQEVDTSGPMPDLKAATPPPGQPPSLVDRVTLQRFETPRAAVTALLRADVDVIVEVPSDAQALLDAGGGVRMYPYVKPYVVTVGLNHRHPALARREVRQALTIAVDRDRLIADDADGFGMPAADLLWRQHWAVPHTADAEAIRVDRPRARQLLDDAGFPERRGADGAIEPRLRLTCLVVDHPTMRRVAATLQRTFASIGVLLDLEVLSQEALISRTSAGEFETFLTPVVTGYGLGQPYVYFGGHDRPRLIAHGYSGAEAAVERVRAATSDDELATAASDLHRLLLEDTPAIYLYWQQSSRAVGPRVRVPDGIDGDDVLMSLARWTVAGAGQ